MAKIVGILNITPDSFSDGGKYLNLETAFKQAITLISDGADVIDIGAESTRPNATPISQSEEWQRLSYILPKLIDLIHSKKKQVSIDTRNSLTAKKAIEYGVDYINDVSACSSDPNIINVVADANMPIIISHNLGIPADKSITLPKDIDVIENLREWLNNKADLLIKEGIKKSNIIFDVGIGFGKNSKQSLEILSKLEEFKDIGHKIYVGHSRKSFLEEFEPKNEIDRDNLTAIMASKIYDYCDFIRVHNVRLTVFIIKNFMNFAKKSS
ncbi:MAG: dihydropteroate synthase [Rickettsiales bacterium]|nr:dihydropteroate synthase [Rickettsiales bacterium]